MNDHQPINEHYTVYVLLKGSFCFEYGKKGGIMARKKVSVPLKGSFVLNGISQATPCGMSFRPLKGVFCFELYTMIKDKPGGFRPLKGVFCFEF